MKSPAFCQKTQTHPAKNGENEKKIRRYLAGKARKAEIGEAHMIADADNYSHLHWEIRNISRNFL